MAAGTYHGRGPNAWDEVLTPSVVDDTDDVSGGAGRAD